MTEKEGELGYSFKKLEAGEEQMEAGRKGRGEGKVKAILHVL